MGSCVGTERVVPPLAIAGIAAAQRLAWRAAHGHYVSTTPDLAIDELLAELGLETAEARALARAAMEADGLTNEADLAWADVIMVWGGTQLDHKVSKLYTDARRPNVVTCSRCGIAALAQTVTEHLARGAARR